MLLSMELTLIYSIFSMGDINLHCSDEYIIIQDSDCTLEILRDLSSDGRAVDF